MASQAHENLLHAGDQGFAAPLLVVAEEAVPQQREGPLDAFLVGHAALL